jgi:capsular polysaccharide biosynthesis protein
MEFLNFVGLIKKKKGTIFTIVFVVLILTLGISLLLPLKYEAKSRLLVVQNTAGTDPYTVSKSNEYLGNLFAQVVYSESFYNLALSSQYNIDKNYFSGDYNQQMKIWSQTIETKTLADTGIIEVSIYHPNPNQAEQIALAVNDVLMNKNGNYQGNGAGIKINVIDQPLISTYPVQPNILQNLIIALAGSLLFSLFYIYLFPDDRYSMKLWPSRRLKKSKNTAHSIKIDYYPVNAQDVPSDPENPNNYQEVNNQSAEFSPRGNMNNILK